jgi:co-chaperonin GroES (HSP10)
MINDSGLRPLGRAVLIKPYEPERLSSIIAIPDEAMDRMHMLEQRAVVVAVGPSCWSDEPTPRAYPGDKVIISAFAGHLAKSPKTGEQYRFVNDRDIFAGIED